MDFRLSRVLSILICSLAVACSLEAQWKPVGPYGGHALKVVIDPSNSSDLYLATKNGQIYHSSNGGDLWEALSFPLGGTATLNALVITPGKSGQLYLAASADAAFSSDASEGGVYRSDDAGHSWHALKATRGWAALSLAIHPARNSMVVVGTMNGVFRSDDGGETWRLISPPNHPELKAVVSLALDPQNPEVIYAGTPHLPWRTLDGGRSWTSIHRGMIDDSDVFSLAVDRTDSTKTFASACSGIYRSNAQGDPWIKMQGIPRTNRRTHMILQDPVDAGTLYAATTQGLWKSVDAGLTWLKPNPYPYIVNSVAIDPSNHRVMYLATDRSGMLKSLDGGQTFRSINTGFINRNLSRFASGKQLFVSSVYDGDFGGVFSSQDGGRVWSLRANQSALRGKNVIALASSPANPRLLFAGTYEGLLRSDDAGATWRAVTGKRNPTRSTSKRVGSSFRALPADGGVVLPDVKIHDVKFSRAKPELVFAATSRGLYHSTDSGVVWRQIPLPKAGASVERICLNSKDANWIMAKVPEGLLLSAEAGKSWTKVDFGISNIRVYDFAFAASGRMLAGTSSGLFQSVDGGKHWELYPFDLPRVPIRQIALSPDASEVFLFSDIDNQVFESDDGGANWKRFNNQGLAGLTVLSQSTGNQPGSLFALTENRGLYLYEQEISDLRPAQR